MSTVHNIDYYYLMDISIRTIMKMLIIILFCWFFLPRNTLSLYYIGVQTDYYVNVSLNSSIFNITRYSLPNDTTNSLDSFNQTLQILTSFSFIIYNYSTTMILLVNQLPTSISYLVIPEVGNSIQLPQNVFYISTILQQTSDCTRALLNYFNTSGIVFLDYNVSPQFKNLVAFNNFTQTLLLVGSSTNFADIFVNRLQYNTNNFYVTSIPLNQPTLIQDLLNEAMLRGQLNPGKVWIFMNGSFKDSDFIVFQQYSNVGASLYSFGVSFNTDNPSLDLSAVQKFVVNDYLLLINSSFFNKSSSPNISNDLKKASLTNGILSNYSNFDPVTNKYNGTVINVRKVNTPTSAVVFTYTDKLTLINLPTSASLNNSAVTVRIGVAISLGYFMRKSNGDYYGYSVAILNELLNLTTFKYVYVIVGNEANTTMYQKLNNLLLNNQADIILIPMIQQYVSGTNVFSDVVTTMTLNMLTRPPDNLVNIVTLVPFTYNVWLGILLIIYLLTVGFFAISALSPPGSDNTKKKKAESYSFGYTFLVIYSSFVMAKLKVKLLQPSSQIFAFILWFATLTLVVVYASNLLPYLMQTKQVYPFSKATDLLTGTTGYNWSFVSDSVDIDLIKNSAVLNLFYFAQSQWLNLMYTTDMDYISVLSRSNFILIQNSHKNGYIYNSLNCSVDLIKGTDTQYPVVFPINQNWPQATEMRNLISTIISSGVTGVNTIIYFGQGPCARAAISKNPTPKQILINKAILLFSLPAAGCFFGILYVLLKILCGKCFRCIKNAKREKFVVGKTYNGKVSSIDNDGVWMFINMRDRPYYINSTNLDDDLRMRHTPQELNILPGDTILMKYFGKDPINGNKRFCRHFSAEEPETSV